MKLSLAHLKSDYVGGGSRQPWEIEKEREAEKRRIEEEKKKEGMKKRMSMVSGGEVKRAFFAQARKAHPGGQVRESDGGGGGDDGGAERSEQNKVS